MVLHSLNSTLSGKGSQWSLLRIASETALLHPSAGPFWKSQKKSSGSWQNRLKSVVLILVHTSENSITVVKSTVYECTHKRIELYQRWANGGWHAVDAGGTSMFPANSWDSLGWGRQFTTCGQVHVWYRLYHQVDISICWISRLSDTKV